MIGSALPNQNVRLGSVADFKALHDFDPLVPGTDTSFSLQAKARA